jgi:putative addiction module component (TIGR02574 family)
MNPIQEIRDQALALSPSERASLAHELILSLDDPSAFELSPEQEAEIQRRLGSIREGTAEGRPADEVFAEIKAKYA